MTMAKGVFIVGYMAAGKTTYGRALARRLGMDFIDLDLYIEQRFRKTVAEIFAERGEEGFRKLEAAMLREAGEFENIVLSCGGGTPCYGTNMDWMLDHGHVVWLDVAEELIVERLQRQRSRRPLLSAVADADLAAAVHTSLTSRRPVYARAHERINIPYKSGSGA